MGNQVCLMYDEFRIKSCRVKIYPVIGNGLTTGLLQIHSAWDRNGSLFIQYHENEADMATYGQFREPDTSIKTYSSLMTKPLLMYQSGSISRNLAAAGTPDNLWWPTSIALAQIPGNWAADPDAAQLWMANFR